MHGSNRAHAWLIHLMAGAALGAVIVLLLWILSGGRPFGEVVGTSDVSAPTSAVTKKSAGDQRVVAPKRGDATLESEPPALGKKPAAKPFLKDKARRRPAAAKPKRTAAAKRTAERPARKRTRSRPKPAVRVVAPPSGTDTQELPVAAVPSPAPTAAPAPAPPAPSKPAKRRAPTYVTGAGEG